MHVKSLKQKRERRLTRWLRIRKKNRTGYHRTWELMGRDAVALVALNDRWAPVIAELATIAAKVAAIREMVREPDRL